MQIGSSMPIGIYEKALPDGLSWEERLGQAAEAGFNFVEMSIDESDSRLSRLTWSGSDVAALRAAISNSGVSLFSVGLSAHRRYPLGSADPVLRNKSFIIFRRAIDLALELSAKVIQLMGYDVYYEPSTPDSRERFLEGLYQGAHWAGTAGLMLALENVDVPFVDSIDKAMGIVKAIDSPWVHLYPDMGNLAAAGYDPVSQLKLAKGHIVGIHVKDALPGVVRGVPFESGIVPFSDVFKTLAEMGFRSPMTVEMWADREAGGDPFKAIVGARQLVGHWIRDAWGDE